MLSWRGPVFGNVPRGHAGTSIASAANRRRPCAYRTRPEDSVMAGMKYDNKAAAQLEQAYATTDMIVQREELRRSLRASAGEWILDLGSGHGFLACELARRSVQPAGSSRWTSALHELDRLERSRPPDRRLGRRLGGRRGGACVCGRGLRGRSLDVGVEYSPSRTLLNQLLRVLRPGGRLFRTTGSLVWAARIALRCSDRGAWNEHLLDLPSALARTRSCGWIVVREIWIVSILNTAYDATTFSYNIASLIAAFVLGRIGVSEDEVTEWLNDFAELQH